MKREPSLVPIGRLRTPGFNAGEDVNVNHKHTESKGGGASFPTSRRGIRANYTMLNRKSTIKFFYITLKFSVLFYLLLFPFGKSFEETGAWLAAVSVFMIFILDFKSTNTTRIGRPVFLFLIFWVYLALNALTSISPPTSWYDLRVNLHMGFGLFWAGVEFVRKESDVRLPVYAVATGAFFQGLDGVWQAWTGSDLVKGIPAFLAGRLTGSFSTYRIGNLLSLYIPVAAGTYFLLKEKSRNVLKIFICSIVLLPPLFLLYGSKTRSGIIGLITAISAYYIIKTKSFFKATVIVALVFSFLALALPQRFNTSKIMEDARLTELWPFAVDVFESWPVFGAGVGTYNAAFKAIGLVPQKESTDIQHPHNIYLQLLCETGLVGFVLFAIFVCFSLYYCYQKLSEKKLYSVNESRIVVLLICSYLGYLFTAFSAHSFFRAWWLGTANLLFGLCVGYCSIVGKQQAGRAD